jgi:DNA-binding NarL/FixJ family response regulator
MKRRISVLLVDDHNLVRRGFRRILEDDPEIAVAGETADGAEAVSMARELHPDVVVMDYALPGMSGVLATRRILEEYPKTRVLMLSMYSEESCVRHAFDAGACGYLLKNAMDLELVSAVKRAAAGETVLDPNLAPPVAAEGKPRLTTRELEILQLIAEGKSNKEIAAQLGLSVNTVAVHRANIMGELDIHKTAELVSYAIRNRLVTLP